MGRLGTRTPGGPTFELHQGNLRIDDGATVVAAKVLAVAAVAAAVPPRDHVTTRPGTRRRAPIRGRHC